MEFKINTLIILYGKKKGEQHYFRYCTDMKGDGMILEDMMQKKM